MWIGCELTVTTDAVVVTVATEKVEELRKRLARRRTLGGGLADVADSREHKRRKKKKPDELYQNMHNTYTAPDKYVLYYFIFSHIVLLFA